jgi:hypothetical protein
MALAKGPNGETLVHERELVLGVEPFTRTDDGSELLNVNGVALGAPVVLWNGTGVSDTGTDWTLTGTGTEQAASGSTRRRSRLGRVCKFVGKTTSVRTSATSCASTSTRRIWMRGSIRRFLFLSQTLD